MSLIDISGFYPTKPGPYVAISSRKSDDYPIWYVSQEENQLNIAVCILDMY